MVEMLPIIYKRPVSADTPSSQDFSGPHDLALIFLVFAVARAALCLQPVLEKPSVVAIQALRLLSIYTAMAGKELRGSETTMETTWSLLALSAQLAQSIGLQTVLVGDYLLVWLTDAGYSSGTYSLEMPGSNSKVEDDPDPDAEFQTWGCRFALQCVAEVAARALAAEPPSYATIMELDRKVREFPVPKEVVEILEDLKNPAAEDEPVLLSTSMERMVLSHCRESFYGSIGVFLRKLSSTVLKTLCVVNTRRLFWQPIALRFCARFWQIWTYAFSAAVVFGTVVTRGPRSPLASSAITQLDVAHDLFSKAALHSRRAAKALPILTRLSEKAHHALAAATNDPAQDGALWNIKIEDDADELEIFAGKTRLVESKRPSPSPVLDTRMEPQPAQSAPRPLYDPMSQPSINPPPTLPTLPHMQQVAGPSGSGTNWSQSQDGNTRLQGYSNMSYSAQRSQDYYLSTGYSPSPTSGQVEYGQWPPPHNQPQQSQPYMMQQQQQQYAEYGISQYPPNTESYMRQHAPPNLAGQPSHPTHPGGQGPYQPPAELVNLGLASRDSRLGERWTSFMQESGFFDEINYRPT
ncbi:hypothetical protein EW026_g1916 [Hermanssonia centrifuga]|uniref:Transcription factor domain-containing protein n=1 Tax=Hermanssonia centrifuga TaxID=98765 RepID=A0A4S4KQI5_9APHY|nr:hypothetical protein EW026_g1916 [Hermanssonia centrifuga]